MYKIRLIEPNFSALGRPQTAQSVQQRGFPGAARSKNPDELARFGHKTCAIQDRTVVALPGEPDGNDPANRKAADADQASAVVDKEEGSQLDLVADDQIVFVETATVDERS